MENAINTMKKSKALDPDNITIDLFKDAETRKYRPIRLLNCIYNLFTRMITDIISKTMVDDQPREQAGFRKGYSTVDHLIIIGL